MMGFQKKKVSTMTIRKKKFYIVVQTYRQTFFFLLGVIKSEDPTKTGAQKEFDFLIENFLLLKDWVNSD